MRDTTAQRGQCGRPTQEMGKTLVQCNSKRRLAPTLLSLFGYRIYKHGQRLVVRFQTLDSDLKETLG